MEKLDIIIKRRENRIGKSKQPFDNYLTKWRIASDLLWKINEKIESKELLQESRRQYIISMITALEVFLKDKFIELIDKNKLDYKNVAKRTKKFTVEEIGIIIEKDMSMGEIIAEYFNFQNLDSIDNAFSDLFNCNFFNELKKYRWYYTGTQNDEYIQIDGDFYPKLKHWIDLRHDFVHDINFQVNITDDNIHRLDSDFIVFVEIINSVIENNLSKQKT